MSIFGSSVCYPQHWLSPMFCSASTLSEVRCVWGPSRPLGQTPSERSGSGNSARWHEQNEEKADSSMPKSDMTTRTQNDYFVHKTRANAKCAWVQCDTNTRNMCVLCASGGMRCSLSPSRLKWFTIQTPNLFCKKKQLWAELYSDGRCPLPEAVNDHLISFSLMPFLFLPRLFLPFFPLVSITQWLIPPWRRFWPGTMQMTSSRSLWNSSPSSCSFISSVPWFSARAYRTCVPFLLPVGLALSTLLCL